MNVLEMAVNKQSFFTQLGDELAICARCGYCLNVCPTYTELGWESASPRARVQLADQLHARSRSGEREMARLFQCTLCSRCTCVCPTGIDLRRVWLEARQEANQHGVTPLRLKEMSQAVLTQGNVFNLPNEERAEWLEYMENAPLYLDQRQQAELIYYVGCVSSFSPAAQPISESFTRLMSAVGLDFAIMGEGEYCCGYPLIAAGMLEEAKALRQKNVDLVRKMQAKMVVFNCPSCALTWKEFYAIHLPNVKFLHAAELLADLAADGRLVLGSLSMEITYHDPCDLGRNNRVYEAPRRLLAAVPGLIFNEASQHRDLGLCCGGGGDLEMTDPGLVTRLASSTLKSLATPGAQAVVTACPQCVRTFKTAAADGKVPVEILDIVQVVDRALKGR